MLGGKDFAKDRMAADAILEAFPQAAVVARASRRFHQRAVRFMVRQSIRQIIDIGSGLPTNENTHQAAAQAAGADPVRTAVPAELVSEMRAQNLGRKCYRSSAI